MAQYHVNPETGEPGICKAIYQCKFSLSEGEHFASPEEGREWYEKEANGIIFQASDSLGKAKDIETELERIEKEFNKAKGLLKSGKGPKEEVEILFKEKLAKTKEMRSAIYSHLLALSEAAKMGITELETLDKTKAFERQEKINRKTLRNKVPFDQALKSPEMYRSMISEFTAWSGLPREEAKKLLRSYDKKSGISRDQYVVSLFQKYQDKERNFVFVDIETTDFHPTQGEIIEVGIIKTDSDGNIIEKLDQRYDLEDPQVREVLGTGPEHIHNIGRSDIEGKETISSEKSQTDLKRLLNDPNNVMVCHNKGFEHTWFSQEVEGYYEAKDTESYRTLSEGSEPGRIMDTRALVMFLGHDMERSNLETFCNNNGVSYENAHNAFADADMTRRAFFTFREKVLAAPSGERPSFPQE